MGRPSSAGFFDVIGFGKAIGLTTDLVDELKTVYGEAKHFSNVSERSFPGAGKRAKNAKKRFEELTGVDFSVITESTSTTTNVRDPRNDADWPKY